MPRFWAWQGEILSETARKRLGGSGGDHLGAPGQSRLVALIANYATLLAHSTRTARAGATLGDDAYTQAVIGGRELPPEQAIIEALTDTA